MAVLVTRASKGTALTTAELDANFTNLNTELASKVTNTANPTFTGVVTFADPTGINPVAVNYPATQPSLMLDFLNTEKLDSRVTFTRASSATRINAQGLVETIAVDKPRFDYDTVTVAPRGLLIEEARSNLLLNTEYFPAWGSSNASVISDATTSPTGTQTGNLLTISAAGGGISQVTQAFTAGSAITVSVFAKRNTSNFLRFQLQNLVSCWFNLSTGVVASNSAGSGDVVFNSKSIQALSNGWYRCSVTVTTTTITTLGLAVYATDTDSNPASTNSSIYIWGIQAEVGLFATSYVPATVTFTNRASGGTYIDATGTLQTAASGVARLQYSLQDLGLAPYLLRETSRTNSIRNNMMTGAVAGTPGTIPTNWSLGTVAGLTYSVIGTGTEKGVTYIDIQVSGTPTANGFFGVQSDSLVAAAAAQTWTGSVWTKLVSGNFTNVTTYLELRETDNVPTFLSNSLTTITIGSALTRYSATRTLASATTAYVSLRNVFQVTVDLAVNFTVRIGMPQLELGASATSVIATTTTAATRAADTSTSTSATRAGDVANMLNIASLYNPVEGTIYSQWDSFANSTDRYVYSFTQAASTTDRVELTINSSNVVNPRTVIAGAALATISGGTYTVNSSAKNSFAYASTNYVSSLAGATAVTANTTGVLPSLTSRIIIGRMGSNSLNGHVQRIAYYPTRLTDAEIQLLST